MHHTVTDKADHTGVCPHRPYASANEHDDITLPHYVDKHMKFMHLSCCFLPVCFFLSVVTALILIVKAIAIAENAVAG